MNNTKHVSKKNEETIQFTFRAPVTDIKKLKECVGPFGKVAGLLRHLIKQHLDKPTSESRLT